MLRNRASHIPILANRKITPSTQTRKIIHKKTPQIYVVQSTNSGLQRYRCKRFTIGDITKFIRENTLLSLSLSLSLSLCVCVCVCERERERELKLKEKKFNCSKYKSKKDPLPHSNPSPSYCCHYYYYPPFSNKYHH